MPRWNLDETGAVHPTLTYARTPLLPTLLIAYKTSYHIAVFGHFDRLCKHITG